MGLRINHNLASLNASLNLGRANSMLSKSLGRLSTGLKINSAADGPADLIISERMRGQIRALSQATENTQTAISMLTTAEGALTETNSLLVKMKGLALKAAQSGTADADEIAASQAEIDAALDSINAIARNTSFGSKFLLDGSLDISATEVDTNSVNVSLEKANFVGDTKRLTVDVTAASAKAQSNFSLNSSGALDVAQSIKVTGNRGSSTIAFSKGATGTDIAKEINDQTTQTGVLASYNSTKQRIEFISNDYGSTEFVQVEDMDGTNDLLRGDLKEQIKTAEITYGGQFKIKAKTSGEAGEKIAIKFDKTSNNSGTAETMAVTQDSSSGKTQLTFTLSDDMTTSLSLFSSSIFVNDGYDKNIETTISEIQALIQNNVTVNSLVELELVGDTKITDKVRVDSAFTDSYVQLVGGATGQVATAASVNIEGSAGGRLVISAKNAGVGGNDIQILTATSSVIMSAAMDSLGSAITTTSGAFSGGSQGWIFVGVGGTIYINSNATYRQITEQLNSNTSAKELVTASFTGTGLDTMSTGTSGVLGKYNLTGGTGLSGGARAASFINIGGATTDLGLMVTSKKHGTEGNGYELVIRNRMSSTGSVEVYGKRIIVNLSTAGIGSALVLTGIISATAAGSGASITTNAAYGGNYFNQFRWSFESDTTVNDAPTVSYDSTTKTIKVKYETTSTTLGALRTAITGSSAILDTETGLTVGNVFTLTGMGGALPTGSVFVSGGVNTSLTGSLTTMSAEYFGGGSGVVGIDFSATTTLAGLMGIIRGNATARDLIDVDFFGSGDINLSMILSYAAVNPLSTNVSTNAFKNVKGVWGDYTYVLTGGVSGNVQTNIVSKSGSDGQVKVNGVQASAKNLGFTFDNGDVRGTITLNEALNAAGKKSVFTVASRGAFFQVGQKGQLSYQTGIALKNVQTSGLGRGSYLNKDFDTSVAESSTNKRRVVGTLDGIRGGSTFALSRDPSTAVQVIDKAISDIARLRAQVGAFISNTLESNLNSLGVAFENLTASESRIRDVDFAAETAEFTRSQILVQAGTSVASQANASTQAALQLLK